MRDVKVKEVKVEKYKGSLIFKIAFACFVCFFVFSLINQQIEINERQAQVESLTAEVEELTASNEQQRKENNEDIDMDKYVEEFARGQLQLVMPQERIFIDVGGQEE